MKSLFLVALLVALLPCRAWTHALAAPDTVFADAAGNFSFEAVFTAGPGDALIGSYASGGSNVDPPGVVSDCFCEPVLCTIRESETLVIPVLGHLVDPEQPGQAIVTVDLCGGPSFQAETVIVTLVEVPTTSRWVLMALTGTFLVIGIASSHRLRSREPGGGESTRVVSSATALQNTLLSELRTGAKA